MRTLIIYNDIETPMEFLIVDGDFTRFHGVLINAVEGTGYEQEFCDWMFSPDTGYPNSPDWTEDKSVLENKEWDKVAICTFLP